MKALFLLIAGGLLVGSGASAAETRRPVEPSQPCPQWGPGFVKVQGSTTCVRLKGRIAAEASSASRPIGRDRPMGSGVNGRLDLETRSETDYGPVRTVVRVKGGYSTGTQ